LKTWTLTDTWWTETTISCYHCDKTPIPGTPVEGRSSEQRLPQPPRPDQWRPRPVPETHRTRIPAGQPAGSRERAEAWLLWQPSCTTLMRRQRRLLAALAICRLSIDIRFTINEDRDASLEERVAYPPAPTGRIKPQTALRVARRRPRKRPRATHHTLRPQTGRHSLTVQAPVSRQALARRLLSYKSRGRRCWPL
jgi:hypothetical protein